MGLEYNRINLEEEEACGFLTGSVEKASWPRLMKLQRRGGEQKKLVTASVGHQDSSVMEGFRGDFE